MHTRQIDIDTANAHSHNHTRTFTLCPSLFYTRIQFIPANGNLIPLQRIQFVIRVHFWFRYRFPPLQMQNQIGPEPISKFESIHHIQQSIIIIRFRPDYFIFCWHPFVQSIFRTEFKLVHSFTRAHARLHAYTHTLNWKWNIYHFLTTFVTTDLNQKLLQCPLAIHIHIRIHYRHRHWKTGKHVHIDLWPKQTEPEIENEDSDAAPKEIMSIWKRSREKKYQTQLIYNTYLSLSISLFCMMLSFLPFCLNVYRAYLKGEGIFC